MSDTGSILEEIKRVVGMPEGMDEFNTDVIMFINMAFFELHQIGVGPQEEPFVITDKTQKWDAFPTNGELAAVKSFLFTEVRLTFDPPTTSFAIEALQELKKQLIFRLNVSAERSTP